MSEGKPEMNEDHQTAEILKRPELRDALQQLLDAGYNGDEIGRAAHALDFENAGHQTA